MNHALRQLLITLMALWMPFCCCQVRAAASVVMAVTQQESSPQSGETPALRHASCCDGNDEALESSTSDKATCSGKPAKPHKVCCISCKERVLSSSSISIDHDAIGSIDFVGVAVRAIALSMPLAPRTSPSVSYDTGPPRAPSGREALALHSLLLI